jgi:murein peptide amidase A
MIAENVVLTILSVLSYTERKVKKAVAIHLVQNWAVSRGKRAIALHHGETFDWSAQSRPIVIIGGVHGDEPEGVALAQAILRWLEQNHARVRVPWIIIPCLNPDGYANDRRTNDAGVDLNRNYPAKSWSPEIKTPRYNPGPHSGSEPEVQALTKLIHQCQPRLIIHCHSWHPCIIVTGEPGLKDGERLAKASGYELKSTIGYDTPGSLSQMGWFDLGIPVICIEEQEGTALEKVWPHFASGIEAILMDSSERRGPA